MGGGVEFETYWDPLSSFAVMSTNPVETFFKQRNSVCVCVCPLEEELTLSSLSHILERCPRLHTADLFGF